MKITFKGGIHPKHNKKRTFASPIERISGAPIMVFPLKSHIGAMNKPLVDIGNRVLVNQKIADCDEQLGVPVHCSVSGKVIDIRPHIFLNGDNVMSIIVENDGEDREMIEHSPAPTEEEIAALTPRQIVAIAREAGLSGMGGAAFPTHYKIACAVDTDVDYLIINGAECEPYLTADHRAMVEYPRQIVGGIQLLIKALSPSKTILAIEDNKDDAIFTMGSVIKETGSNIKLKELITKYPAGAEKQLIKAIAKREIPPEKLPLDVGCVVFNVDTCASLYRAVYNRTPVTKRVVTVSGPCIRTPKNLLARIGTPINFLIDYCGGFTSDPYRIITGGPMMGNPQYSLEVPVTKGMSGIIAISDRDIKPEKNPVCIRCGRCVEACPVKLMPIYINMFVQKHDFFACEELNAVDCIECGSCSYICPGKLDLTSAMRLAKFSVKQIIKERKESEAGNE